MVRMTAVIKPGLIVEPSRFNDERIAIPSSNGIAEPGGLQVVGKRTAISKDLPVMIEFFLQKGDTWRFYELNNAPGSIASGIPCGRQRSGGLPPSRFFSDLSLKSASAQGSSTIEEPSTSLSESVLGVPI
jgi:hypothetical protein